MDREHRDRNVYILGAGFSAPAGAPVIRDFLDKSREFYDDPATRLDGEEEAQFRGVYDFKQKMRAAREKFLIDLDNVEELFGLVEIAHRLKEGDAKTKTNLIYLIAKTLQLAVAQPQSCRPKIAFGPVLNPVVLDRIGGLPGVFRESNAGEFAADMYDYFAALVAGLFDDPMKKESRKDTIITFNYDLICDDAFRRLGMQPNYHLPNGKEVQNQIQSRPIDVLKLHGSANWVVCPNCKGIKVLDEKVTEDPQGFRNMACSTCGRGGCELLLVPPTWDKTEHQDVIGCVWSRAVDELRRATRVCIIGYSMPKADAFFRYLLTLALSENDGMYRFAVVDPDPKIERRYRRELDRTFQKRRFVFPSGGAPNYGVAQFLGNKTSLELLGRGESIIRYTNSLP